MKQSKTIYKNGIIQKRIHVLIIEDEMLSKQSDDKNSD